MKAPVIAIVVPCYNEEQVLPVSIPSLLSALDSMVVDNLIAPESYLMCCDDGSKDSTWNQITRYHQMDSRVKGLRFSNNRGQQFALLAGLLNVVGHCDAAITIDADLQDDVGAMHLMVEKFRTGTEIVYGVRHGRESDSWFKRNTARGFYSLQRNLGLETVYDHADFRLMSRNAIKLLSQYGEQNLFLRGIVPLLGLTSDTVEYDRKERCAGSSKYSIRRMLGFSIDGITSFSSRPIRMILTVGVLLLLLDIAMTIYVFISYMGNNVIPGWTSLMLSVWFLGSLILISLGIVGEYIGKIFVEVKNRPRYIIKEYLID